MSSAQERATGYQQGASTQGATGMPGATGTEATAGMPGTTVGQGTPEPRADYGRGTAEQGYEPYAGASPAATGGMYLAGTLLVLAGIWGFFVGLTGILKGAFYTTVPTYTFTYSIKSWGWTHLIIGIVVFAVGVCLLLGQRWARYVGVFLAVVDAVANFLFLPYYPLWSIIVIAIDVFIIWALLAVGRRQPA
jgi:hypothetical protein